MTEVLGLGHDVVDLDGFSEQLALPGSRIRSLFSTRELRQTAMRAELKHDGETAHLAVRWAGKEAVLKAWSQALGDRSAPYTVDDFPWAGVEILDDGRGRPGVHLREDVQAELVASMRSGMGERATASDSLGLSVDCKMGCQVSDFADWLYWRISLTSDGSIASAIVIFGLAQG